MKPPLPLVLLWRFHAVPAGQEALAALRTKPLLFAVALFLAGNLVVLALSGRPVLELPPGRAERWASLTGLSLLVFAGLCPPWAGLRSRTRLFFSARPRGTAAFRWYAGFRAAAAWSGSAALTAVLTGGTGGPEAFLWLGTGLPLSWAWARFLSLPSVRKPRTRTPGSAAVPALGAWYLSHPGLFFLPPVVFGTLMAWAWAGGGGFVWADRPPVAGLLVNHLWPLVFGLFWTGSAQAVPRRFFRMARPPFGRILAVLGVPVLVQTALVLVLAAGMAGSPEAWFKAAVLNTAATAFWFFFWLRWDPPNLVHLAAAGAVVVAGLAADQGWWSGWALALAAGAAVLAAGWKSRMEEAAGEDDDA